VGLSTVGLYFSKLPGPPSAGPSGKTRLGDGPRSDGTARKSGQSPLGAAGGGEMSGFAPGPPPPPLEKRGGKEPGAGEGRSIVSPGPQGFPPPPARTSFVIAADEPAPCRPGIRPPEAQTGSRRETHETGSAGRFL